MHFTKKKYNFRDVFCQDVSVAGKARNDRGFFYRIYRLSDSTVQAKWVHSVIHKASINKGVSGFSDILIGCLDIPALLAWIIPMTVAILSVFVFDQEAKPNPGHAICVIQFPKLSLTAVLGLIYLAYFIIVFCYWKIYRKVKMHNANLSWQSSNAVDVKVSKTLFVTVASFVSLFTPANIVFTLHKFLWPTGFPSFVSLLAVFLIFMTSCTNPFIYGYMNRAFRSEFKKFLLLKRGPSVAEGGATGQNQRP